jgi:predicted  nucleic acid-binding Zn-ribbon protein
VLLSCTACQHLWTPTPDAWSDPISTGCPRCGGWTWLVTNDAPLPLPRDPEEETR